MTRSAIGLRAAIAVGLLGGALAIAEPAQADPWIPAAGTGVVKPMMRWFDSNGAYSANGFTTATQPASMEQETQLRVTGVAGIGHGFSIEYDLRAGHLSTSRLKHHRRLTQSSTGLEDQIIGLNYGLTQTARFADSLTVNLVIPTGASNTAPALGVGHFAIEPDVQFGIAQGPLSVTMQSGGRIFTDSGVAQLRATAYAGLRVSPHITLLATGFVSRTVQQPKALPLTDQSEIYNIVRVGAGVQYELTHLWRPFVEYETTVAGQGIHAGRRIVVGVDIRY
ncbi:MAG TPA: hypothetical protein PK677_13265 [Acidiphilium sp.]|nr:MAG: hypothetical protein B7Z67_09810 [Acidiphilium sp. 21-60-14]OYV89779.1 MAG: hypothetical protein B7Z57_11260 [Acidiphilium sp. 37-60-79]OZB39793.1 MAG: hypothetical protein B7X48_07575 [Acidiphilium sp. 34-60-192]HQT89504.1 hypothetical protein [Acidiphilium sp.]HQU24814.1 hypothetical protein [Acidiphilium sp.]